MVARNRDEEILLQTKYEIQQIQSYLEIETEYFTHN